MVDIDIPARFFTCIDCGKSFPIGIDIEREMYLECANHIVHCGGRCVYCYNIKTTSKLDVQQCWSEDVPRIAAIIDKEVADQLKRAWECLDYWQTIAQLDTSQLKNQAKEIVADYSEAIMQLHFNA